MPTQVVENQDALSGLVSGHLHCSAISSPGRGSPLTTPNSQQGKSPPFSDYLCFLLSQPTSPLSQFFPTILGSRDHGQFLLKGNIFIPTLDTCMFPLPDSVGPSFSHVSSLWSPHPKIHLLSLLQDASIDVYWNKSILSSPFQQNTAFQIKHALCEAILL